MHVIRVSIIIETETLFKSHGCSQTKKLNSTETEIGSKEPCFASVMLGWNLGEHMAAELHLKPFKDSDEQQGDTS